MEAYFDYNATTPIDPRVFEAMKPFLSDSYGNASSFHQKGQGARHAMEEAREKIADYIEVEPGDIIFTSGGTESDNLALQGAMFFYGEKRKHLVVSSIEHQAVLFPAKELENKGYRVTYVPVDARGLVDMKAIEKAISEETALVSVMHVNNEVGTLQPVDEIAKLSHKKGALFHTDAVQSFGKIPVVADAIGADFISISSHKIYGPKGAGALYVKKGVKLKPMIYGGHQEKNIRPGTENVAAIVGFGRAVELASVMSGTDSKIITKLKDKLYQGLLQGVGRLRLNGDLENGIYNTLNISFEGLEGETLLMNLDLKNIYVSTGSACTAGSIEPSHVLIAMGIQERMARSAIRFSLGRFSTEAEVDYALREIPPIVRHLRKISLEKKVA